MDESVGLEIRHDILRFTKGCELQINRSFKNSILITIQGQQESLSVELPKEVAKKVGDFLHHIEIPRRQIKPEEVVSIVEDHFGIKDKLLVKQPFLKHTYYVEKRICCKLLRKYLDMDIAKMAQLLHLSEGTISKNCQKLLPDNYDLDLQILERKVQSLQLSPKLIL